MLNTIALHNETLPKSATVSSKTKEKNASLPPHFLLLVPPMQGEALEQMSAGVTGTYIESA